jgi:hypothetical protein
MNAAVNQYIWQAIQDSERSDDLSFIDALKRSSMPQPDRIDRPGATNRAPITTAATAPSQTHGGSLPTMTSPSLSQSEQLSG